MSRKFLVNIDLNQNQLLNAAIQNLATAPSSPVSGQVYYNTSTKALYIYDGSNWNQVGGITYGTLSARPTASSVSAGTFYYATDNYLLYYSNASTWQQVDNFGTGQSTTTSVAGSSADGTSTNFARADHAHAGPGFGAVTSQTTFGGSSANGSATTVAHSDHTHGTPSLGSSTPGAVASTSGAAGSASTASASDHTHGLTPANFTLDTFGAPAANVSFNSKKITNLLDPTSAQDGATKNYVDSVAQGLDVKGSVRAATTTAGTLATSFANGQVIDGVTLVTGDRILIKNQATQSENGIYTVNASGAPTRSTDLNIGTEVPGAFTFVEEGTTLADTGWVCTTNAPVTIGSTNIVFAQFSGAGTYAAGNGLSLSGNTFSFNPTASGGLQAASGGASILLQTNSGLATTSSGLAVGAGTGISVGTNTVSIDTAVVARKFSQTLSTSSTSYTITHNLGTLDVIVQVYAVSDGSEVIVDNLRATTNTVTLNFSVAPSANAYRVVILG